MGNGCLPPLSNCCASTCPRSFRTSSAVAMTSIVMRSRVCNYWNLKTTLPVPALNLQNCATPELSSTRRGERENDCENNRANLQLESKALAGGVVALGKFDALHVGHRALADRAAELGVPFLVSFAGMAEVLGWEVWLPVVAPCDRPRVLGLWAKHCRDMVPREHVLDFVKVRSLSPEQFVAKLAFELKVKGVVAGANYRFGYKAAGDASDLVRLCHEHGLQAAIVDPVMDEAMPRADGVSLLVDDRSSTPSSSCRSREKGQVSTTRVRQALATGDMRRVAELLGRRHRLVLQPERCWELRDSRITVPLAKALNQPPRVGEYECRLVVLENGESCSRTWGGQARVEETSISVATQELRVLDMVAQQRQIAIDFVE